jgi:hypothetical protein
MRIREVLLVLAWACAVTEVIDARQRAAEGVGVRGVVLTPDGAAVTAGSVALVHGPNASVNGAIDRQGRFHLVPETAGRQPLFISVGGFAPYRVNIAVPSSKRMELPPITLQPATYVRARFVTTEGEPIPPSIRRRSVDADGATIPDPLSRTQDQVETDGTITIGPLPIGGALLVFDRSPFAQTRLPNVQISPANRLVDLGTIVIQPGGTLHVDIVNAGGEPVPRHDVWIDEAVQPAALFFPPARTNDEGRATFTRLAPGRYRVWTRTVDRCFGQQLTLSRLVPVGGSGESRVRVVAGGRARFKLTWPLGPLTGRLVSASPETPSSSPPRLPLGIPARASSCGDLTDKDGRVTLEGFPPGATQVRVSLFNSIYSRTVTVPEDGREIAIEIPDGLLPVRVINQKTTQPIGSARLTWKGRGGSVEAVTNANGDALLESIGPAGGTLAVAMRDYQEVEGGFDEAPTEQQEVALKALPPPRVQVRVMNDANQPVGGAVLHLLPQTAADPGEMALADGKGTATLVGVRPGVLTLVVSADGYAVTTVQIADEDRLTVVVRLSRADERPRGSHFVASLPF